MHIPGWFFLLAFGTHVFLGLAAAAHATVFKRSPRAAMGWVAVSLTLPFLGSTLYFFFGINRLQHRARRLRAQGPDAGDLPWYPDELRMTSEDVPGELVELARVSEGVTGWPLVGGNAVEILYNGEQAYPVMLEAIRGARERVYLATYIFESNRMGNHFVDALVEAKRRGVDVRVVIDGVGEIHIRSDVSRRLRSLGVPTVRFLPPRLFPPAIHVNLRNHRKILVIDGRVAFTGGMNIGDRHLVEDPETLQVADVHCRIEGPVVAQVERTFLDDWAFVCDQDAEAVRHIPGPVGKAACRAIVDGPDDFINRMVAVLVGAISSAHRSVRIMNPYFLPPRELLGALQGAALRGVQVTVVLPAVSDSFVVHWATRHMLWEMLQWGVDIFYQPPPFVHSKLFVVDERYAQMGSSNLDPRSLRLNFELNVEIFDDAVAGELAHHVDRVVERSRRVTLEEVDRRSFLRRLVDGTAWLFTPYL